MGIKRLVFVAGAIMLASLAWSGSALAALLPPCSPEVPPLLCKHIPYYDQVTHTTGAVNGVMADIWTWYDSQKMPRTIAFKMEGNGNSGHGGYAIQMTYYAGDYNFLGISRGLRKVVVNADSSVDGGFGYFVSHERYRTFSDGSVDTIASKIFGADDSPLGNGFAATSEIPDVDVGIGVERFTIDYYHYGTAEPSGFDAQTGTDSPALPATQANSQFYAKYSIPVTTSWVMQAGTDYPRIDVSVFYSFLPQANLVSFDVRGPYGVMVFDNGADNTISNIVWGDQAYKFTVDQSPPTRSSGWDWSTANSGARYQALVVEDGNDKYEMGLFEPVPASSSALVDGYASERGYTNASYAASGGTSHDSCATYDQQTLPSDGNWPYQSIQYSLPCPATDPNFLTDPASFKKIAWGSSSYYGMNLSAVYDGQKSFPINGYPPNGQLQYSVCLVLGVESGGSALTLPGHKPVVAPPLTEIAAAAYTGANLPKTPNCATGNAIALR